MYHATLCDVHVHLLPTCTATLTTLLTRQLGRKNLLGRMSPKDTHVQQLAAKQLLENPGVMSVLKAFAEYRKDRQNHLGLKPGHCFNVQNDASWLP